MDDKKGYKKLPGGAGAHGFKYQNQISLLFLLEGYLKDQKFRLSTENKLGGKLDDVILETEEKTVLLQAKHKENPKDKKQQLTFNDLFPSTGNKNDFNIFMYAKSFAEISKNFNNVDKIIICTNVNVTNDKNNDVYKYISCREIIDEEHPLSCNKIIYFLKENCKETISENVKCMSEERVVQFLKKFELIVATDGDINARIQKIIQNIPLVTNLGNPDYLFGNLEKKVEDWFIGKKGVYLTFQHIETYLLYSRSQNFTSELQKLQVKFKFDGFEDKNTCCIIQDQEFVNLHIMKIYQNLKENEVLIVNPKDPIEIQIKTVSAFTSDEIVSLIVPLLQPVDNSLKRTIQNVLTETSKKMYKRIIIIMDDLETFHQLSSCTQIKINCENVAIEYDSLSEQTQIDLSNKEVNFQGKLIPFSKMLPKNTADLNAIIDEHTLYLLFNGKLLEINKHYKEIILDHYIARSYQYVRDALPQERNPGSFGQRLSNKTEKNNISEQEFYEQVILKGTRKVILVSDEPGMGKSTMLLKLQQLLNQDCFWIVKINLNECTNVFKDYITVTSNKLSLEKLMDRLNFPIATKFEKKILKRSKKFVLLLDGYDEISPDYDGVVIHLIKSCINEDHVMKIILTTRPYCQKDIKSNIDAHIYKLNKFQIADQIKFLYDYWTEELELTQDIQKVKCKEYVENVCKEFLLGIVGNNLKDLIEIPLQCKMISEIFRDDCLQYVKSTKISKRNPLKQINIKDMYHRFIEKKKKILLGEKFFVGGNKVVEKIMNVHIENAKKEHVKIALKLLFDETELKYFNILQTDLNVDNSFLLRMGILKESNECLIFIHKTFAEYFVAVHICDILCEPKVSENFLSFFVKKILCNPENRTLLSFMNILLNDKGISKSVLQNCSRYVSVTLVFSLTAAGYENLLRLILDECDYCPQYTSFKPKKSFDITNVKSKCKSHFFMNYLHLACEQGWNETVKYLIHKGMDVNAKDHYGRFPLHSAVLRDNVDVVKTLIEAEADINVRDDSGNTSFSLAHMFCSIRCAKYLLEHGCDVNQQDLRLIVQWQPTSKEVINVKKLTVKRFLQQGFEVNSCDKKGNTPLHYAAESISVDEMKILMNNNADINIKNNFSQSALHKLFSAENRPYYNEIDELNALRLLFKSGVNINDKDKFGRTPFLLACASHSMSCVKYLIDRECDVSSIDKSGRNALHYIASWQPVNPDEVQTMEQVISCLIQKNVDVNSKNIHRNTPLHIAIKKNSVWGVKLLKNENSNVNITNNN